MKRKLFLLLSKDEKYLVKSSGKFNTRSGVIDISKIKIGKPVKTHLGKKFSVVNPNIVDILRMGVKRTAQVILPKDIALILAYTGITNGSLVVDAGTGTGYTPIFLANYIPNGKIVSYEKDKRFFDIARKNVDVSSLTNVKLKHADITKGIKERNVDVVVLDLQNADKAVKYAYNSLKVGGYLIIYSPTVEHLKKSVSAIRKKSFIDIKTVENIVREWQTERTIRPKTIGLMHTGFLTFARKV
jgi:tRNA (adenine57-N1/adenine58-N1)-methyltransferase